MLHLLLVVKDAMASARRTQVTREDFDIAFAAMDISTSSLQPHVDLKFPSPLAHTRIPPPRPAEPPPPDLAPMLGPQLAGLQQRVQQPYIPHHFPPLPSRHTWQNTPVFTEREKDPRKIRERATEEGILAEQALRKLTAANRSRSRIGKGSSAKDKKKEQLWQETMGELLNEEGAKRARIGTGIWCWTLVRMVRETEQRRRSR
ncbi:hypothetical protein H2203_004515 [Taxawa tesnikishii (nom. ined.)]|nr:hypothetical protein H2203_004515 [Dothideales sp. JES 119]